MNRFILLVSLVLLVSGCTDTSYTEKIDINNYVELDKATEEISKREFSYIDTLSEAELLAYENFAIEKDIKYLKDFTPEKNMLIYIHSIVIDDVEAIYSLTYDNGELPNFSTFKGNYYENLFNKNNEMALDYRYYDSLTMDQQSENEDERTGKITVNFGNFTASTMLNLKKQNGFWKVDILHLLEK